MDLEKLVFYVYSLGRSSQVSVFLGGRSFKLRFTGVFQRKEYQYALAFRHGKEQSDVMFWLAGSLAMTGRTPQLHSLVPLGYSIRTAVEAPG